MQIPKIARFVEETNTYEGSVLLAGIALFAAVVAMIAGAEVTSVTAALIAGALVSWPWLVVAYLWLAGFYRKDTHVQ
jgi:hypothetical protein